MTGQWKYQFLIYSKEELIQNCKRSGLIDCRVNAYPDYTKWEKYEIVSYPPNFLFIDIDLSNFAKYKNPKRMLDKTLKNTLNKISSTFSREPPQHSPRSPSYNAWNQQDEAIADIKPTVLWSGNGYHIYLPIQALILDNYEEFSKQKFNGLFSPSNGKYRDYSVSEFFLSFAKQYLTDGKADPLHTPKYKSCLIRIPNTFNSKCLEQGLSLEESRVKIIQKWNGYRPPIQLLTKEFRRWLIQEEVNQRIVNKKKENFLVNRFNNNHISKIEWIERLLQTPLEDYRKFCLWRILCPYLFNTRRLSKEETVTILEIWLQKCDYLRKIDFNPSEYVKNDLRRVKSYWPPKLGILQEQRPELYRMLKSNKII